MCRTYIEHTDYFNTTYSINIYKYLQCYPTETREMFGELSDFSEVGE